MRSAVFLMVGALAGSCMTLAGGCARGDPSHDEAPIPYADPEPASAKPPGTQDRVPDATARSEDVLRTGPFDKSFEGITLSVPSRWQEVKLGGLVNFVDARFVIPAGGTNVEMTCLSTGAGINDNVRRWVDQFTTAPEGRTIETIQVDGVSAQWVDLRGTFNGNSSGRPGPHLGWRMLAVAIPIGSRAFTLKLNGPEAAVAEVRDAFREFVKSARITKP